MEPLYRAPSWPLPNDKLTFIDSDDEEVPCKAGEVRVMDSVKRKWWKGRACGTAVPQCSCGLVGPEGRLMDEMPAASAETPTEAAPTAEVSVVLQGRFDAMAAPLHEVAAAALLQAEAVGSPGQQLPPFASAAPASSSVCRHGDGEEDSEDDADGCDKATTCRAASPLLAREKSSWRACVPAATVSEVCQATSTADDEMSEAVAPAAGHRSEPEPSVQGGAPLGLAHPAMSCAQTDVTSAVTPLADYTAALALAAESPFRGDQVPVPGHRRRGRTCAMVVEQPHVEPPVRRTRRAARMAAVTVAAAARSDQVAEEDEVSDDEDMDDELASGGEDGYDEDYVMRVGPGGGTKRTRTGLPYGRTPGRLVSGSVCRECGIDKTPQWRIGPEGPRTLCNACGVRYKKTQKSQARAASGRNRR